MEEYRHFKPEQFAADKSFRNWKLHNKTEDLVFWKKWLEQNPEKRADIAKAENLLEAVFDTFDDIDRAEVRSEMDRILLKLPAEDSPEQAKRSWHLSLPRLAGIAAALVLAVAGGLYFSSNKPTATQLTPLTTLDPNASQLIEHHNTSDRKKLISLPDESTVLLMPGSRISYKREFNEAFRKVSFSGEAFFEVTKNDEKPFLVVTDNIITKVLGTSFTVISHHNGEASVTVKTGSVSVYRKNDQNEQLNIETGIVLKPNERIVFSSSLEKPPLMEPISEKVIETLPPAHNIVLDFYRTPIAEVIASLENAYDTRIRFNENEMKNCLLTASLQHEPFYRKLDLICRALDAHYRVGPGGEIEISGDGCD